MKDLGEPVMDVLEPLRGGQTETGDDLSGSRAIEAGVSVGRIENYSENKMQHEGLDDEAKDALRLKFWAGIR